MNRPYNGPNHVMAASRPPRHLRTGSRCDPVRSGGIHPWRERWQFLSYGLKGFFVSAIDIRSVSAYRLYMIQTIQQSLLLLPSTYKG